jgi:hypothetical protein
MDRQLPVMPRSEQTSIAVRRGCTTRELEHHKLTLAARQLALHLRFLKRAANPKEVRTSKRQKGDASTNASVVNDDDADCFYDDTTAPPVTDANDGVSDEVGGDDTPAVDPRNDAATKKRVAEPLPGMALNERDTRRMTSCLARQMNFPSECNEVGQPNWRGGEGGTMSATMKLSTVSCSANTVCDVLRRTHDASMDGALDEFDAGDVTKSYEADVGDFEIMLAIRNLRDGRGCDLTLMVANELREACVPAKPLISRSSLRRHCKSWGLRCHRRQSRGTGDKNFESLWAQWTHVFDVQLQHQFNPDPNKKQIEEWPDVPLESVMFFDEHHRKCRIGKGDRPARLRAPLLC